MFTSAVSRLLTGFCFAVLVVAGVGSTHPIPALSQTNGSECQSLVETAMSTVGTSCAAMGRNEACYGHMLVAATFQENAGDMVFETSGDVAQLVDLQALVTEPADPEAGTWGVALMKVQADLPDAGNAAMTFVLFGDAQVTNAVDPSAPKLATCKVANNSGNNINVRGGPGTDRPIVDVLEAGAEVTANGRSEAGDWLRIGLNGALGWVSAPLVSLDCEASTLAVVEEGAAIYDRPMQVFVLQSGTTSTCEEAPDGLLIQAPAGQRAHVMVNGVQLEFTSAAFMTAQPDGNLIIDGLEGQIAATASGQTVTVNPGYQTTIPLTGLQASGSPTAPKPYDEDLLQTLPLALLPNPVAATPAGEASGAPETDPLAGIGPGDACTIAPILAVNRRSGPGTSYPVEGQLAAGQTAHPDGQATGVDGFLWWRLTDGSWIRSDVVVSAGQCGGIPSVEAPEPPTSPPPSDGGVIRFYLVNYCYGTRDGIPIEAGQTVVFSIGCCGAATIEEQQALETQAGSPWITLDGVPLSIYITGIFWSEQGWYSDDGRYEWVATPGTHTVSGGWGGNADTCTFTVE